MKKLVIPALALMVSGTVYGQTPLENLGSQVNSAYPEARPTVSADGKLLYFVVEGNPKNTNYKNDKKAQDVWFSEKAADGTWGQAQQAPPVINALNDNAVFWIAPDGNRMMIRGAFDNGKYVGRGVSMVYKEAGGWSAPQKLDIPGYEQLSKDMYSGAFMASTGKTILFYLSEEKNAFVNDIYVSHLDTDGKWSKPESIGSDVNTFEYDEISPFLAADNVTLYFSSNRKGGAGSHDIWMTRRLDSTWKKWSTPVALKAPVNSKGWDAYFALDATGEYAYMATSEGSANNQPDLVKVKLDDQSKPNAVVLMFGKVLHAGDNTPVNATFYYDKIGGGNEGNIYSNPDGTYKMVLPYGGKYVVKTTADSFNPLTDTIDLTNPDGYKEIHRDLYLTPEGYIRVIDPEGGKDGDRKRMDEISEDDILEEGETVSLDNILFVFAKHYIQASSIEELNRLVRLMKANPGMHIELAAHTDWIGSKSDNLKLSKDRATAVKEYLVGHGIEAARITEKGYGESKPLMSNLTEEGRRQNRRVEFTVIKK
ncbi:MAG TPA: OmpA family protein [Ferruginibacter sp.]|nr:OmpA family protein [Ferruginibacter sp.]HRO07034.1 OmpA family protein [Ferruginibacter sp.]HRO97305.1 OmpA family protein [Ferruginibacter sp.]HRP50472.1 OmpA family protein [Ferruginibacter sp.]